MKTFGSVFLLRFFVQNLRKIKLSQLLLQKHSLPTHVSSSPAHSIPNNRTRSILKPVQKKDLLLDVKRLFLTLPGETQMCPKSLCN